jgi:UDP-N-acetylglucosamine 2-epimerase (non-hydrolysing)/GDP/UDP-N,N'-diacetylbacillosamine 2-epimerase (hydrolysing)
VLDAEYDAAAIHAAVLRCLFDETFRMRCLVAPNPYWLGDAGPKIADVLAKVPLDQALIRKRMTLIGETRDGWYR